MSSIRQRFSRGWKRSAQARQGGATLALMLCLWLGALPVPAAPASPAVPEVLPSLDWLWRIPAAEQGLPRPVDLEVVVYFYDPLWKTLWGRVGGMDDFLSVSAPPFAVKPGQRIRIKGTVVPIHGPLIDQAQFALLAEGEKLEVTSAVGRINDMASFNKRLIVVEGYVDRTNQTDLAHLELDLVVQGRPVIVRQLLDARAAAPAWQGAWLRLKGVYSATVDPNGAAPRIELWVQSVDQVEVLGWLERDARFGLPVTPIEKLGAAPADALVRVLGTVGSQQRGKSIAVRDATGQATLLTAQTLPVQVGDTIEAFGYPVSGALGWGLDECLYRRSRTSLSLPETILLAEQLRELQPDEAERGKSVQLTGVVTWAHPEADFFFMRDASGGARVTRPREQMEPIQVGSRVEVSGVSSAGRFSPEVRAATVRSTALLELPEAKTVILEQALTGLEQDQWVSLNGSVREMTREGPWTRLEIATPGGEFDAMLPAGEDAAQWRGAAVRVRGVCTAIANTRRQLTGIRLWVPSSREVEVEEAMPANPFSVQERSIASLRQFNSPQGLNRRVRVSGTVIHQIPGRLVRLQEAGEALLVLSRDLARLQPGDRIEAVGFPGRGNNRLALREAVVRRVGSGPEPAANPVSMAGPIDAELDGELVRVEGTLLDFGAQEGGVRLILQEKNAIFAALLDVSRNAIPSTWGPGTRLALTGVYVVQLDEYRRPATLHLQLRTAADVQVLAQPSWWTVRRLLSISLVLLGAVLLGFGWVLVLRRRVRRQTGQIHEQVERERAARMEAAMLRTSKLESLGVLAGGIAHDFNNLLTAVMGNISLAKMDTGCDPETVQCLVESERAALRARDLTQQLLTFAKGGAPVRTATVLPEIVEETARFATHGSKALCQFDIAADLWPAHVDRAQIAQVVQNIVLNANDAMPAGGTIYVVLQNATIAAGDRTGLAPGRYLKLSVSDTGSGIDPAVLPRIFEPYFTTKNHGSGLGLATAYSIVKQHQGHIEAESKLQRGTTVHLWLPAAELPPEPVAAVEAPLKPQTGRVLFMDDEAQIRDLASAILKRLGLEVTAVDDGSAVILEYAAARDAGRPFDLVILDLTVPGGMGGAKAMERLRQMDPQVRAIVSSGYSSDPVLADYRAHGFSGIVPKPYVVGEVAKVIEAVLQLPRQQGRR